jgi:hypothetical protein
MVVQDQVDPQPVTSAGWGCGTCAGWGCSTVRDTLGNDLFRLIPTSSDPFPTVSRPRPRQVRNSRVVLGQFNGYAQ